MNTYHKIQSIYKRDPDNNYKTFLYGKYSRPEFEYLANVEWIFTEKIDGTNIRIMWRGPQNPDGLSFNGKTDRANVPGDLMQYLYDHFIPQAPYFDKQFGDTPVCIYGEGYGPGIQKVGHLYRDNKAFVAFDILIGNFWLRRGDVEEICADLSTEIAPIVGRGRLEAGLSMTRDGFKSQWSNFQAEGIVARPAIELRDRSGERIITKIKTVDFINE